MCCYESCLVFHLLLRHDISQGSVATHSRCGGTFSDVIIANFCLILTVKLCQIFRAALYVREGG